MHKIFWLESLKKRDNSEDLEVNGILLECISRNKMGRCGLDASDSGQGPVAGFFEHGNEFQGSQKKAEILLTS
jgi:hypothetical protein